MVSIKAKAAFTLYNIAAISMRPIMPLYLSIRAAKGKEDRFRKKERMAYSDKQRPKGPLIWFHAASVGETLAIFPLLEYILSQNIHVLITTGTVTSAKLVEERYNNRLIHQYAPLDFPKVINRFLNHWKPDLALVCESEIWPSRIMGLAKRHIPQIMVNAHMSQKSFDKWCKNKSIAQHIFSKIDAAITQNEQDSQQYKTLGVKIVTAAGNLKADSAPLVDEAALNYYAKSIENRLVFAAISTHEGEESIVADVHIALKSRLPNLLTIIVPRHPERCDTIIEMLKRKNLNIVRRSKKQKIKDDTDIFLGDTIGEMGLFLKMSKVAFIGKSLKDRGGHNPIEPALLKVAILTGPYVENFQTSFDMMLASGGARIVDDATKLAVQINTLLTHDHIRNQMIESAYTTASHMSGALEESLKVLKPLIHPLIMQAKLTKE